YHPEWEIEALSMESPEDLQGLVQRSDHLIVTHTCLEEVTHLTKRTPDLVVNFQVDEQSVAFLNKRIQQIRLEKIQAYHSDID
ncbi:MAG: hypothetical protein JW750_00810, partial [Anaerolineaceae bacterium]|nr:hypothetical protein [Anaerolineaceae bacterium]